MKKSKKKLNEDNEKKSYDFRVRNDELKKNPGAAHVARGERQAKLRKGREEIDYV